MGEAIFGKKTDNQGKALRRQSTEVVQKHWAQTAVTQA